MNNEAELLNLIKELKAEIDALKQQLNKTQNEPKEEKTEPKEKSNSIDMTAIFNNMFEIQREEREWERLYRLMYLMTRRRF